LVEDSPDDAELALRELRRAGFDPDWERVETEAAYLDRLHDGIDIILSDFQMPEFDGMRALRVLKELHLDIPFILISGTIGEEVAVQAMKQGATDYLLKDRLARLGPAVTHAIEESRLRKDRRTARETLALRERALGEVSQGVLICDENRKVIYANESFTTITGYEQDEVLGKSCAILQGPETDPATVQKIRTALAAYLPFEGEILNYRKDGTSFWNELSLTPIRDRRGGPIKFIGIQRDVTERKLAREALIMSEEKLKLERAQLRALIDSIPDLIFFKDPDSIYLGCNRAFEKYLGVTEADLIGRTDFDLKPETADFYRARDREVLTSGQPQVTEEWIHGLAGRGGQFETLKTPYYGPTGESLGLVAVSRDVTERKKASDELRAALDRLKIATQAAQLGIWELDVQRDETTWDAQMFAIFGMEPSVSREGVERWFRVMVPEDVPRCQQVIEDALFRNRDFFDLEFRIRRADNQQRRLIRSVGIVNRTPEGALLRMIGINQDVTEDRRREEDLTKALAHEKEFAEKARAGERSKGEFLAAMSHELRTPMSAILGFSELLTKSRSLPDDARDYAETILQSGEALLRILDDILDFSRLEAGRLQVEAAGFDPRKVTADLYNLFLPQAEERGLKLETTVEDSIPPLLVGDAGRIRQVLVNLVGNALKFTPEGSVSLSLRRAAPRGDEVMRYEFLVKDTGAGISAEKIEAIFQPFTQADSSISRRYGGTGLGLTISRRLTELLGGTLTAKSTVGEGSEFLAVLPLKSPEQATSQQAPAQSPFLNAEFARKYPLRILVVDDDRINLKLVQTLIRRLGYEPYAAQNGREALEIYDAKHPDCILMDLQMPEMDGIEATEAMRTLERRTNRPPAYISALTANILPADRNRCFEVGMDEYLNKPIRIVGLAQMLTNAHSHLVR
jgi:PAS domain S-box-containing protein